MDGALVGREYADHLTDQDLKLLICAVSGGTASGATGPGQPGAVQLPAGADAGFLRHDPAAIPDLLGDPRVFDAVFGWGAAAPGARAQSGLVLAGQAAPVSPFLTFAVAVHRSAG